MNHRVAHCQRRDRVADAVRERVVPRSDHANDADRLVTHEHLATEQERAARLNLLVGQVLGRVLGPEPERAGGVAKFGEYGVLARLTGLRHNRVEEPLGVVEHPLLRPAQHLRSTLEPERLPARLSRARPLDHPATSLSAAARNVAIGTPVAGFSTTIESDPVWPFACCSVVVAIDTRPFQ